MPDLQEQDEPEEEPEQPRATDRPPMRTWLRTELRELGRESWNASKVFLMLLLLCGVVFPASVYALGQLFFPSQANGSLLVNQHNQVIGSRFIGQSFTWPVYFHGRPSVVDYDASNSNGSNLGPTNPQLLTGNWSDITLKPGDPIPANATPEPGNSHTYRLPGTYAGMKTYAEAFRKENALAPNAPLPADIVTASGSGLDPDISVEAALLQVNRVVKARQALGGKNALLTADILRSLIARHTSGRDLGILGEPRVNVLELNLDLDTRYGTPPAHT